MPISTFKLIEHFAQHDNYSVSVVLPGEGELAQHVRQCGIEPVFVPFSRLRSPRRFREFMRFVISFPSAFLRTVKHFKKNKIDLVHFSDIIDMPFYPCALLARIRSITHLRHCIENTPGRIVFNIVARLCLNKVVCISDAVKRYSGLPGSRTCVVYNPGPDMTLFNPDRSFELPFSLPKNSAIILAVGKFVQAKGHEHMVAMAKHIEAECPGICHYVIIGDAIPGRSDYKTVVIDMIQAFGLEHTFTIIPQIPHELMPAVLARTTVLAHLPNWQEGLGGVVLEAMAMEVPVVAFDSGGVGECFSSGSSGFLVPYGDVRAAADAVITLQQNPELQKSFGAHARKELTTRFSYQKHFSSIEELYKLILR